MAIDRDVIVIDQPQSHVLLLAMADALDRDVLNGNDEAAANYTVRVVANLSRILAREAELGARAQTATEAELRTLLDQDGDLPTLAAALDRTLTEARADLDGRQVFDLLKEDVARRLAIARPDYSSGDR